MEDFFGEGQVKLKFSKEQQQFFNNRLQFLDREKKKSIPLSTVLYFLGHAKIDIKHQKKILNDLDIARKPSISYEQMKKVFRGVALAQINQNPSLTNINANPKIPLPKFYDDQQDSQQNQPQSQQPPPPVQPQTNLTPPVAPKQHLQATPPIPPPSASAKVGNIQLAQTSKPANNPSDQNHQSPHAKSMKKFEDYWSTFNTENGVKISGNEVKKLFGKSQNRKQLSKIWKLCSNTYKGYLSKGELYIFMALMKSKNGIIPSSLTPQMKQAIRKFDGNAEYGNKFNQSDVRASFNFQKSHNFDQTQFDKSTAVNVQKKPSGGNRASGNFNDFDDFANFANQPVTSPKFHEEKVVKKPSQQIKRQIEPFQERVKQPRSPEPGLSIKVPTDITEFPRQATQSINSSSSKQLQTIITQLLPQLQLLSTQNKQYSTVLQQTNQFMNNIDQGHLLIANKINEIKASQEEINQRINQSCVRMQNVIFKQNQLLNLMLSMMGTHIETSKRAVNVLQEFNESTENQVNQKVNVINQINMAQNQNSQSAMRNSITTIPQRQNSLSQSISHMNVSIENPSNFKKKSIQGVKQMRQSITSSMRQSITPPNAQTGTVESAVPQKKQITQSGIGMYPQKLRAQLFQNHRQNIYGNMQQSTTSMAESKQQISNNQVNNSQQGYHWEIGDRQQIMETIPEQQIVPGMKKTLSQQSDQDDAERKQRMRQQQQIQRQKRQLEQQKKKMQQMAIAQQQQALLQAQMQAQMQAQLQAQMQAQQALLQQHNQAQVAQNQQPAQVPARQLTQQQKNLFNKKNRLLLIINEVSSLSNQDYKLAVERINAMSQNQIDAVYAVYYKEYERKRMVQQQQANKKGEVARPAEPMPTVDQFSSNNFKNQVQKNQYNFFKN